jgi:hypothetical protein
MLRATAAILSTPANDANYIIILPIGIPSILVQCSRLRLSICSGVARPRSCSSCNGTYSDTPAMSAVTGQALHERSPNLSPRDIFQSTYIPILLRRRP